MKHFLSLTVMLALAACEQPQQRSTVAALESGLTAADIVALQYTSRPVCPAAAPVCADPTVKAQIKGAAMTAYTAVKAAEASAAAGETVDLTNANAAVAAFQALLASPPVKGN